MSIPPRFLDEIRARVSVSEIVGRTVKLTKAGREYKGCCPFHHEKTPSFTVNDDKQFYHCFGCGEHGDVINFLQKNNNLSFMETIETLAALAGLQVPKATPEDTQKAKKAKDLYDLMEETTAFLQKALMDSKNRDVLEYAQSRGLGSAERESFRIGFAPPDRQALRKYLLARGYSDKDMIEAGVTKPSSKGGEPYAFFNDRLMFPVTDRRGRIIAFGGRALPEHLRPPVQSNFKPPKYINSGDTALFDKGRTLYAIAHARQASAEGKPIIVTEGYMDVIACHKAGFTGAVAPMGTALTEDQIALLWKMITDHEKIPILCFDGDAAGRKAAARSVERILPLLKPGHSARFAFLPDGKDPDDLIKEAGSSAFQKVVDAAIPLAEYLWLLHTSSGNLQTPEARAGVAKDLRQAISTIADAEVQKHYTALINEKINQAFFPRNTQAKKYPNSSGYPSKIANTLKPKIPAFRDIIPKALLAAVLNHPSIYGDVEEEFSQIEFAHADYNNLRHAVADMLNSSQTLDNQTLQNNLTQQGYEKEMSDILCESVYIHAAFVAPGSSEEQIRPKWKEAFMSWKASRLKQEIRQGWQKAFETANEDEAQSLAYMVKENKGE